ncbi:HDR110Cp [Eremothecium sinecaudum]|uniref:HDR110Cp n=1 Tax=Eremothecium sinecaudum TaxID=45286 RepID=A0A109UZ62_9SACH|nr:HDR110Cp [Eremothecium sinecaudum]AMD20852.1 HDR110Cp [Eremothecium sinecaudum]
MAVPVAIITGGTKGIGHQLVSTVLRNGLSCIFIGSNPDSVRNSLDSLIAANIKPKINNSPQFVRGVSIDFNTWPQWTILAEHPSWEATLGNTSVHERLSPLFDVSPVVSTQQTYYYDLLVNCAGITQNSLGWATPASEVARLLNINLASLISMNQLSLRPMIRARRRFAPAATPTIINVSSQLGWHNAPNVPGTAVYAATKSAVLQYTNALQHELASSGVTIKSIAPGLVQNTNMTSKISSQAVQYLKESLESPPTTPEALASAIWRLYCPSTST